MGTFLILKETLSNFPTFSNTLAMGLLYIASIILRHSPSMHSFSGGYHEGTLNLWKAFSSIDMIMLFRSLSVFMLCITLINLHMLHHPFILLRIFVLFVHYVNLVCTGWEWVWERGRGERQRTHLVLLLRQYWLHMRLRMVVFLIFSILWNSLSIIVNS